ncbi:MAG: MarR family winged helix-turn-helix transcriptional regulator [Pseudonocardiales bacterium]
MIAPVENNPPGVHACAQANRGRAQTVDSLALVLGPLRAQTLRATGRPITAGRLATRLQCAPNTVTYHCTQLESAGLIVRERRGPSVWISRTGRGQELIDVMAGNIDADPEPSTGRVARE